ncbi:MAG: glutamate racemase, partial [Gemmatimonadales bacterium]
RVPYGPKSPETVRRYSREILEWLLRHDVKAVVVACNTATAHALDDLQAHSPVPVIGVIEPGARAAVAATKTGTVGVIGTAGTIASGAYVRALLRQRDDMRILAQPCPLLVPLVEEGWFDHPATLLVANEYLSPLRGAGIDALVLGCTHYPMLAPLLGQIMGPAVQLIDSARETARELARVLVAAGLAAPASAVATERWIATDDAARFSRVGALFMGSVPAAVEIVEPATVELSAERFESDL